MVGACQQNSGIFLVRGGGLGQDVGEGRGRDWDEIPAGKSPGRQRTRSGQGPDEIPARAEAGTGTRCRRENHRAGSGAGDQITWAGSRLGAARDRTRCRRGPRLGPGQDAGGGRGLGRDKMPARKSPGRQRAWSG